MPSPASSIVEALHQTLSNEVEDYRQLVNLTQHEHVALQNGSLTDLITTVQSKESMLSRLVQREENRQQLMTILLERLQLPASASLADLITCCDEIIAQKLATLRQEFINLVEQLNALNHDNQVLLQSELARVNATFNFAMAMLTPDKQYTINGLSSPVVGNIVNRQI